MSDRYKEEIMLKDVVTGQIAKLEEAYSLGGCDGRSRAIGRDPDPRIHANDGLRIDKIISFTGTELGAVRAGLLNVNRFIQEIVHTVQKTVNPKVMVRTVLTKGHVQVFADQKKLRQVFAALVSYANRITGEGGTITVLARLLPIDIPLLGKSGGKCALLSVRSAGNANNRLLEHERSTMMKSLRNVFHSIRSFKQGYKGAIRILAQPGETKLNVYLPVEPPR